MFPAITALSLIIELSSAKTQGQNLKIYFKGNLKKIDHGSTEHVVPDFNT